METDLLARRAEDVLDIRGYLREAIAWPCPTAAACVLKAKAIRVDEAAEDLLRPPINEFRLSVGEPDPASVLWSGSVLREVARPLLQ